MVAASVGKRGYNDGRKESASNGPPAKRYRLEGGDTIRLCPIYLRDVLSFLPREQIDELRTASRRCNAAIATCPDGRLPRRRYHRLEFLIGRGNGHRCSKEGFVNAFPFDSPRGSTAMGILGKAFQRIPSLMNCCLELKEEAGRSLANELVIPSHDANTVVVLRLTPTKEALYDTRRKPTFRSINRLTKKTAATLLHFLAHLDKCALDMLFIEFPAGEGGDEKGLLNPRLFETFRQLRGGRPLRIHSAERTRLLDEDEDLVWKPYALLTLKTAYQLTGTPTRHYVAAEVDDLPEALELITTGRTYCRERMEIRSERIHFHELVDGVIKHFVGSPFAFKPAPIPEVWFDLHPYDTMEATWPSMCPKEDAEAVRDERKFIWQGVLIARTYDYTFLNSHTGQRFRVTVGLCSYGGTIEEAHPDHVELSFR